MIEQGERPPCQPIQRRAPRNVSSAPHLARQGAQGDARSRARTVRSTSRRLGAARTSRGREGQRVGRLPSGAAVRLRDRRPASASRSTASPGTGPPGPDLLGQPQPPLRGVDRQRNSCLLRVPPPEPDGVRPHIHHADTHEGAGTHFGAGQTVPGAVRPETGRPRPGQLSPHQLVRSRPPVSAKQLGGRAPLGDLRVPITITRSASSTVDRRWAMTIRVALRVLVDSITVRCVSLSRALVASSKKRDARPADQRLARSSAARPGWPRRPPRCPRRSCAGPSASA